MIKFFSQGLIKDLKGALSALEIIFQWGDAIRDMKKEKKKYIPDAWEVWNPLKGRLLIEHPQDKDYMTVYSDLKHRDFVVLRAVTFEDFRLNGGGYWTDLIFEIFWWCAAFFIVIGLSIIFFYN
jgi:hypothetical protein